MSQGRPDHGDYADEAEIRVMVERYAGELKAAGAIESETVERAFRTVQRHRLLETFHHHGADGWRTAEHDPGHPRRDHLALIYADTALATRHIGGRPASSTSQAALVGAAGPGAQRRPGRLGRPGARRGPVVGERVPGPRARPPLPRMGRAGPTSHRGLPDLVRADRHRRRSGPGRLADRTAVLP